MPDDLDLPAFLRMSQEERQAAWRAFDQRQAAKRAAATPAVLTPALALQSHDETELSIHTEADRRWRTWLPPKDGRTRSRPQLRTFVRLVRRERKLAAREAAKAERKNAPATAPKRKAGTAANLPAVTNAVAGNSKTTAAAASVAPRDKPATAIELLSREDGATVAELCAATGWQPHTLRARLSGLAKPVDQGGRGLTIIRSKTGDVTSYRIPPP